MSTENPFLQTELRSRHPVKVRHEMAGGRRGMAPDPMCDSGKHGPNGWSCGNNSHLLVSPLQSPISG